MSEVEVADNPEARRYEAHLDGELAGHVVYRASDDGTLVLVHTVVLPEFEGRGVASGLASALLEDVRRRGLKIVPMCSFIRGYLERHPEHDDLVVRRG